MELDGVVLMVPPVSPNQLAAIIKRWHAGRDEKSPCSFVTRQQLIAEDTSSGKESNLCNAKSKSKICICIYTIAVSFHLAIGLAPPEPSEQLNGPLWAPTMQIIAYIYEQYRRSSHCYRSPDMPAASLTSLFSSDSVLNTIATLPKGGPDAPTIVTDLACRSMSLSASLATRQYIAKLCDVAVDKSVEACVCREIRTGCVVLARLLAKGASPKQAHSHTAPATAVMMAAGARKKENMISELKSVYKGILRSHSII